MNTDPQDTKKTEKMSCPPAPKYNNPLGFGSPLGSSSGSFPSILPSPLGSANNPFIGNFGSNGDINPFQKNNGMLFGPGNDTFDNVKNLKITSKAIRDKYPNGPPGFSTFNGEPNSD